MSLRKEIMPLLNLYEYQRDAVLALIDAHESRLTALVERWRKLSDDPDNPGIFALTQCADDLAAELKR